MFCGHIDSHCLQDIHLFMSSIHPHSYNHLYNHFRSCSSSYRYLFTTLIILLILILLLHIFLQYLQSVHGINFFVLYCILRSLKVFNLSSSNLYYKSSI